MANTISSLKRVRQENRRQIVNHARTSRLRSQLKAMREVLAHKDAAAAQTLLPKTFSTIDRSARLGIIKKNTAARYKSRLTLRIRKLAAA